MAPSGLSGKIAASLSGARVLLIIPPFGGIDYPSLALHLLQAVARARGIEVDVLYANLALAAVIGESDYGALSYNCPVRALMGERFFAQVAYGRSLGSLLSSNQRHRNDYDQAPLGVRRLPIHAIRDYAQHAGEFVDQLAACIAAARYEVVGCSTTFEQTSASIAILDALKRSRPQIVTLLGGCNCEAEMAAGMASLAKSADFIFSGESEISFPAFLESHFSGLPSATRIIRGEPYRNLDALPEPDFREYFEQLEIFLPGSKMARNDDIWLPCQSSRGCWWGSKHPCTFCGINGEESGYRMKSPGVVFEQIASMLERYPSRNVFMDDSIMPTEYFKTLLPRLEGISGLNLFYEQKANLTRENVVALKRAGVNLIQPGIESLSTSLLRLMNKGVTARQNINLLRDARSHDLAMNWNILFDFPADPAESYGEMVAMIPHIVHLYPPGGLQLLSIERFSSYFRQPAKYGISGVRPLASYDEILPDGIDTAKVAYHFVGDYLSGAREHPELIRALRSSIGTWIARWADNEVAPSLCAIALDDDAFVVLDTRYAKPFHHFLTREELGQILTERRIRDGDCTAYDWALSRHLMLELDGFYVPIVTGVAPSWVDEADALCDAQLEGPIASSTKT